jgi:putative PIN family toxin of toxin-antitoxin system
VKIVFDPNVLFSAFITQGLCPALYEECLQGAEIIVSPHILSGLATQLRAKARLTNLETREVIEAVRADSKVIRPRPLAKRICRDLDDDAILAAALSAKADAIVTGDQDLIVLKNFRSISIWNPRDCLAHLATQERS